jgi:hypothetical protein
MSFDEMDEDAASSALGGGLHRDDERDLVCASTPTFATVCLALLAAQNRIVHLDAALERTLSFDFADHRTKLLAQPPGRVPLDGVVTLTENSQVWATDR